MNIQQRNEELKREIEILRKNEGCLNENIRALVYKQKKAELKGIEFAEKQFIDPLGKIKDVEEYIGDIEKEAYNKGKAEAEKCFKEMIEGLTNKKCKRCWEEGVPEEAVCPTCMFYKYKRGISKELLKSFEGENKE